MGFFEMLTGRVDRNNPQLPAIQIQEGVNGGLEAVSPTQSTNNINPKVFTSKLTNSIKNTGGKLSEALFGKQPSQLTQDNNLYNLLTNSNPVNEYQDYLRQNGYEDKVVNGVTQGLNHGYKEIDDWIKQYNEGAGSSNPINIPQTQAEIELARQGLYNKINTPENSNNSQLQMAKAPVGKRIGGAIPDLFNGFKENFNNGFSMNNWGNNTLDNNRKKGMMYRAGEGLGTVARMINSPLGRGVATAGLIGLTGGTGAEAATYGLQTVVNNQQNVLKDNLYRQSLIDNYGYTPEQLNAIGYLGDDTYKVLADSNYKSQKLSQEQTIAQMKDNTSRARMIGTWLKNGQISPQEANVLISAYGISDADFQVSDSTRKTNSQIALNDARIENINNPKPRVNVSYRYGNSNVKYNHNGGGSSDKNVNNGGTPIGAGNGGMVRVKAPNGAIKLIPQSQVSAAVASGGEVL